MLIKNIIRNLPIIAAVITMSSCSVGTTVNVPSTSDIGLSFAGAPMCTTSGEITVNASTAGGAVINFSFFNNNAPVGSAQTCTTNLGSGTCSITVPCNQFAAGSSIAVVATSVNPLVSAGQFTEVFSVTP